MLHSTYDAMGSFTIDLDLHAFVEREVAIQYTGLQLIAAMFEYGYCFPNSCRMYNFAADSFEVTGCHFSYEWIVFC